MSKRKLKDVIYKDIDKNRSFSLLEWYREFWKDAWYNAGLGEDEDGNVLPFNFSDDVILEEALTYIKYDEDFRTEYVKVREVRT